MATRKEKFFSGAVILFACLSSHPLNACLWDYDTLAMERSQFPSALELMTGKCAGHSEAFYRWRIADRLAKLETGDQLSWYDELAVAYDKAVEVILKKDALKPGLYET